jgi:hypothetical protein
MVRTMVRSWWGCGGKGSALYYDFSSVSLLYSMSFTVIILEYNDNKAEDATIYHIGNYDRLEEANKVLAICVTTIDKREIDSYYSYRCEVITNKDKPVPNILKDILE